MLASSESSTDGIGGGKDGKMSGKAGGKMSGKIGGKPGAKQGAKSRTGIGIGGIGGEHQIVAFQGNKAEEDKEFENDTVNA